MLIAPIAAHSSLLKKQARAGILREGRRGEGAGMTIQQRPDINLETVFALLGQPHTESLQDSFFPTPFSLLPAAGK